MNRSSWAVAVLASAATFAGCNVFQTTDDENVAGRGARSHDPYQGAQSGTVRLSLQMYNGCAILPTGEPAGNGGANIPYPECRMRPDQRAQRMIEDPSLPAATEPLPLLSGTSYVLNQLTFIQSVVGLHTNPHQLEDVPAWFRSLPAFGKLDWRDLALVRDEVEQSLRSPSPYAWRRRVLWGGAAWQKNTEDTFLVELLDADGQVRQQVIYDRKDLLVQNHVADHTTMLWEVDNIAKPLNKKDTNYQVTPPAPPGYPPSSTEMVYRSLFKLELVGTTSPALSFTVQESLSGFGAIRVTWSQLPQDPFHFPVRFVQPQDQSPTCYSGSDPEKRVPCTFGLLPQATFSQPANGQFYEPGETVQVTLQAKDGAGNFLHHPDEFPSWNEYAANQSNGLLYFNFQTLLDSRDLDTISAFRLAGPKQEMRPEYELNQRAVYKSPTDQWISGVGNEPATMVGSPINAGNFAPGASAQRPPTTYNFKLPPDAAPGTYTLYWKLHRYFMGERFTKLQPIDFQVGQVERTQFPNRIGNCQLCHRGSLSLDNVRHGMSVDYIEGCQTCHSRDLFAAPRISSQALIHNLHMNSPKYPAARNDCAVCHLTRESALRTSLTTCGSCHISPHGSEFEEVQLTTDYDPKQTNTVYGNCATSCHEATPPGGHLLPEN